MKQKLCVIGEALIDFIPQRKGCDLKDVEGFSRVAGGAPANVAGAVAKLGVPAMVLTQLGKDAFGDHIIESLKEPRSPSYRCAKTATAILSSIAARPPICNTVRKTSTSICSMTAGWCTSAAYHWSIHR